MRPAEPDRRWPTGLSVAPSSDCRAGPTRCAPSSGEMQDAARDPGWLQDWTGKRVTSFGDRLWWTWQLTGSGTRDGSWRATSTRTASRRPPTSTLAGGSRAEGRYVDPKPYDEAVEKGIRSRPVGTAVLDGPERFLMRCSWTSPIRCRRSVRRRDRAGRRRWRGGLHGRLREALPFDAKLFDGDPCWCTISTRSCGLGGPVRAATEPDSRTAWRSCGRPSWLGRAGPDDVGRRPDGQLRRSGRDGQCRPRNAVRRSLGPPLWHSDIGGYTSINAVVKNYAATGTQPAVGADGRRSGS